MKLYVVSLRAKLVAVLSIVAFIMIAVVSSADLTGKGLNGFNIHYNSDELKLQSVTDDQWASIVNPEASVLNTVSSENTRMSSKREVLYTLVAAAVIGGDYDIFDHNDDDPSSSGNTNTGF